MKKLLSITDLEARYPVEHAHAVQVTALARALFEGALPALGMPRDEWALLEAACRLHDLGSHFGSARHAARGAWEIVRQGLAGYSHVESLIIAAAVAVHPESNPLHLPLPLSLCRADWLRAQRLAAILRVADALDHGHLQDATLQRVRCRNGAVTAVVRFACCPENADRATRRADLWQAVFEAPLQLEVSRGSRRTLAMSAVLRPGLSVAEAARRILRAQYMIMQRNLGPMRENPDPIYLHDFRVALRRLRCVLRFFRRHLPKSARRLGAELSRFSDILGPFRDAQTSLALLEREFSESKSVANTGWAKIIHGEHARTTAGLTDLRTLCDGPEVTAWMAGIEHFLRADLPAHMATRPDKSFDAFAARKLRIACRKLARLRVRPQHMSPERLHRLRKKVRRSRYLAEFAAPALGRTAGDAARLFKRIADALGDVHDLDVLLEYAGPPHATLVPASLRDHAVGLRLANLQTFSACWTRLNSEKFGRRIDDLVEKA